MSDVRRLGGSWAVPPIGLGCWPLAGSASSLPAGRTEEVVHAALDAGVRLFDTARAYCEGGDNGAGERQLAAALSSWSGDRDDVVVATKVVLTRVPSGAWRRDGRATAVRTMATDAMRNLEVDHLDLLQAHAVDPAVPWSETVGALFELRDEGLVREVGLSNVSAERIHDAAELGPVASVQNETGADGVDEGALSACDELGIAFLPYSPFGGEGRAASLPDRHPVLGEVGAEIGASPWVVCLAWLLAVSPQVVNIPASTRPSTILDSVTAITLDLPDDAVARIDAAVR